MLDSDFKNLNILCGHYGSGKTNMAVNLALTARRLLPEKTVSIADLDIVNPYFRTADAVPLLQEAGIRTMIPEFANSNVDIPVVPPQMIRLLEPGENEISFVDVGGDDGAVALGMYRQRIEANGYDLFFVVNAYRPLIAEPSDALECMREIEEACGLHCTKLINNSSLGAETTADDVLASVEYAHRCAELCSIPLICHAYCPEYAPDVPDIFASAGCSDEPLLPILNVTKRLY